MEAALGEEHETLREYHEFEGYGNGGMVPETVFPPGPVFFRGNEETASLGSASCRGLSDPSLCCNFSDLPWSFCFLPKGSENDATIPWEQPEDGCCRECRVLRRSGKAEEGLLLCHRRQNGVFPSHVDPRDIQLCSRAIVALQYPKDLYRFGWDRNPP